MLTRDKINKYLEIAGFVEKPKLKEMSMEKALTLLEIEKAVAIQQLDKKEEDELNFKYNLYLEATEYQKKKLDTFSSFKNLLQINDIKEANVVLKFVKVFVIKKRDYKFLLNPHYNNLLELCSEFITKTLPIIRYLLIRLYEQGLDDYYKRWSMLLSYVDVNNISYYYSRYNSSYYGKSIYYYKLNKLLEMYEYKIHMINLLVYALFPSKDKPIRQQTVGVPISEYEELFED